MIVNLFTFVGLYARLLTTASHLLTKGAAHAKATGASEAEMLDWRLIEDMQPLRFQLMVVCNFTRQWPARVAGVTVPEAVEDTLDVAGFQASIADAKTYLATLRPEQFAGRDDVSLSHDIGNGMEPTLPAGQWLTVFATTNLYFHLSTAYGILRAKGVPIGKIDLFAAGL
ncbi:MAG: DUF1993 domain-containing protein [Phenylobacterium sp.]